MKYKLLSGKKVVGYLSEDNGTYMCSLNGYSWTYGRWIFYSSKRKYTGIDDINEKEIYEGDRIKNLTCGTKHTVNKGIIRKIKSKKESWKVIG